MRQKINELSVTSPYKEMLEKYEKEDTPILSCGLTIDVKSDIENGCYVMNKIGYYLKVRDIQNSIEISVEDKIGSQRPIKFYKY